MTRTAAILMTLCFPTLAAAGAPADTILPMEGDAVRVLFSAECGPCQADLAAAQALHDRGATVVIEAIDGVEGFDAARALKAEAAPSVSMVTATGASLTREVMRESRAMVGRPPTLAELKAEVPVPAPTYGALLESRISAYDAAMNALWQ